MGYNICHYGNLWRNIAGFERWEVGVRSDERKISSPIQDYVHPDDHTKPTGT